MEDSCVSVPHPDKAEKGGEDACFVLRDQGAFGVMDGVGGWAEEGVDPAVGDATHPLLTAPHPAPSHSQ